MAQEFPFYKDEIQQFLSTEGEGQLKSLQKTRFNELFLGMQCISIGHHVNLYTDYAIKSNDVFESYLKMCMSCGVDQIFEYWKERNRKINLLADKSPTQYEYLKEKIYNQM